MSDHTAVPVFRDALRRHALFARLSGIAARKATAAPKITAAHKVVLAALAWALAGLPAGAAFGQAGDEPAPADTVAREPKPYDQVTVEDCLADLRYLAETLPEAHKDWDRLVSEAEWAAMVSDLEGRMPAMSKDAALLALVELVARGEDPHTGLSITYREFGPAAVGLLWLADGLFVTAAMGERREIIGGRVVKVGPEVAEEALERLARLTAWSNESWKRQSVPGLARSPRILAALRLSDSAESLSFEVECRDGSNRAVEIGAAPADPLMQWDQALKVKRPRWLTRMEQPYWYEVATLKPPLARGKAAYVAYNRCTQDATAPFGKFVAEVLRAIEANRVERVVVDLRHNSGGNSQIVQPLIEALAQHAVVNQPDRLFVLIGPRTFSSGMMNAHQFSERTRATLVGEPTGGKPNHFGELQTRYLPRTGLRLFVSTKYFHQVPGDDPSVMPDFLVELTSEAFFAGRDPVLERIAAIPPTTPGWGE